MAKTISTLKSMTGFGSAKIDTATGTFQVEVQGVNRRHLEISCSLPRALLRFETEMRKAVSSYVGRGQVNLFITWKREGSAAVSVTPNLALAKALKTAWVRVAEELHIPCDLTLSLLATEPELFARAEDIEEQDAVKCALQKVVDDALQAFNDSRLCEGNYLGQDIKKRLALVEEMGSKIASLSVGAPSRYREKLQSRISEFFSKENKEDEEKIVKEVALFADKIDITEEITRFNSHLLEFHKTLDETIDVKGKKLEFLLQELAREVNTMGSKAQEAQVITLVVNIKSELEKIREQVQNIE